MATLQQIIKYSKANPTTPYAQHASQLIKSGAFDAQATQEGVDLSWAGRPKSGAPAAKPAAPGTPPNAPEPSSATPAGAESALMPASTGSEGHPFLDALKAVPNALGDVGNLVKAGSFGTLQNLAKIPGEAGALTQESGGVLPALKNFITSVPHAALDTLWSMVPQSAKELGNVDALAQIPEQFKQLAKENGGSYVAALKRVIANAPGAVPQGLMDFAGQLDKARQAVENHPVNEALGYAGLKALSEHPATAASFVAKSAKNVGDTVGHPIETAKTAAGAVSKVVTKPIDAAKGLAGWAGDIASKGTHRVQDNAVAKAELAKEPAPVQKAVKTDIPLPQAKFIAEAKPAERTIFDKMLSLQEEGVKNLNTEHRPEELIGQRILDAVKAVAGANKKAAEGEGGAVGGLDSTNVNYARTSEDFQRQLHGLNVEIADDGSLNFHKSQYKGAANAKDRSLLTSVWNELKPNAQGEYVKNGNDMHIGRQSLFNEVKGRPTTDPFSAQTTVLAEQARSGLLHDINDQGGAPGKAYKAHTTNYAITQKMLEDFYSLLGKKWSGKPEDALSLRAGEVFNRIEGNAAANPSEVLDRLEQVAKDNGFKSDVDPRALVKFNIILKEIVGDTQGANLAASVKRGNEAALPDSAEVLSHGAAGNPLGMIKSAIKFTKGNTTAEKVRALRSLLGGKGNPPGFQEGVPFGPDSPKPEGPTAFHRVYNKLKDTPNQQGGFMAPGAAVDDLASFLKSGDKQVVPAEPAAADLQAFLKTGEGQATPKELADNFVTQVTRQLKYQGKPDLADKIAAIDTSAIKSFKDLQKAVAGISHAAVKNWLKTAKQEFETYLK